jgi:subtilisin family serine protease
VKGGNAALVNKEFQMNIISSPFAVRAAEAAVIGAIAVFGLVGGANASAAQPGAADGAPAAQRLIVGFDQGLSASSERGLIESAGATKIRDLPSINAALVDVGSSDALSSSVRSLEALDGIRYAEPDFRLHAFGTPTDPMFPQLWGMTKIEAPGAWDLFAGGPVTVADIDTGIDASHRDLSGNLWVNPGEIAGNRIDDDRNGVIDDVNGANFYEPPATGDPEDEDGHGTHTAGTIAAKAGNSFGVAGVNPTAKIMAVKFLGEEGGTTSGAIASISYATKMGARVINASWGGGGESKALKESIGAAGRSGVLFVAAAGNDGENTDESPHYPSAYDSPNIVSVAASNASDELANFSNYGSVSVDLAAPGVDILSTIPGDRFYSASGTSMATPHVVGVAALLAARTPSLGYAELKARLLGSVTKVAALSGQVASGGRLNARAALAGENSPPPAPAVVLGGKTLTRVAKTRKVSFVARGTMASTAAIKVQVTARRPGGARSASIAGREISRQVSAASQTVTFKLDAGAGSVIRKAIKAKKIVSLVISGIATTEAGERSTIARKTIRIRG